IDSPYSDTLLTVGQSIVVTTLADEDEPLAAQTHGFGDLSLREALVLAALIPGANTITFSPALFTEAKDKITLNLSSTYGTSELVIGSDVQIVGPGLGELTIEAVNSRVFHILSGKTASISGLTIAGGEFIPGAPGVVGPFTGGGIYNEG